MFAIQSHFSRTVGPRLTAIASVWGGWTLFGFVFATQRYIERSYTANPTSWARVLTAWAVCAYLWAALTPLVVWLARRYPITRSDWSRTLIPHIAFGTILSIAHLAIYLQVLELLFAKLAGTFASLVMLEHMIVAELHFNLVLYGAILAVAHYLWHRRRLVEQGAVNRQLETRLEGIINEANSQKAPLARIAVKTRHGLALLKTDEITFIRSDDNYVHIHCAGRTHLHRASLSGLMRELDPSKFVRIRRSVVLNLDSVKELLPVYDREFIIVLQDGTRVQSSRRYRKNLNALLAP